jgi:hypothetical protein
MMTHSQVLAAILHQAQEDGYAWDGEEGSLIASDEALTVPSASLSPVPNMLVRHPSP